MAERIKKEYGQFVHRKKHYWWVLGADLDSVTVKNTDGDLFKFKNKTRTIDEIKEEIDNYWNRQKNSRERLETQEGTDVIYPDE